MNVLQLVGIYFICCQVLIAFSKPQGNNIYFWGAEEIGYVLPRETGVVNIHRSKREKKTKKSMKAGDKE